MLRKMLYRKIVVASSLLLVILMLYLIPANNNEISIPNQQLEYIYPNDLEVIYLLDSNDYLSRTKISASNKDLVSKSTDLIESLIVDGKKKDIISNGFRAILPKNTKVLNISLKDEILSIDFSSEFNNIEEKYEEKLIESLIYTLTSIDGIKKIEILVEGKKLTKLPNSKELLPEYLDKSYGINKKYELTSLNDIYSYTVYYVNTYNNESYYTPVTKYINSEKQDKVKIIIDELATSITYETNLMSYLDANVKLLDYEIMDNKIKLNFNNLILSDITSNVILEEVIYTIGLSLCDELDVEEVIFQVNNEEISTFSEKSLD
ncbi:MAG: GerMN domain-containing protein [Bacilli bacterium]|nr:GerMN domain-containing protein [Bacilli bacterium]